jgi:hypothetical protein
MRSLAVIIAIAVLAAQEVGATPPPPRAPYHVLLGPYEYQLSKEQEARYRAFDAKRYKSFSALQAALADLPHGKRVPRYYTLDDKHYTSVDALKAAVAALPAGSAVYLRGSCQPDTAINLPPQPISLAAFQSYCRRHHITFTWRFGFAT